jgi:hypothetical protein
MSMTGWYPRRRGILDHLERGTVSLLDIAVHDVLSLWADHKTGICFASAHKIIALCPADFSYKSVQRSLAKLEKLAWIKRWMKPGQKGNYPVLVSRFFVRDVSMNWMSTNADRTTNWRDVQFDPVHDPSFSRLSPGHHAVHDLAYHPGGQLSPVQEVRLKNKEKRNKKRQKQEPDANPASPSPAAVSPEIIEAFEILRQKPFGSDSFQQAWAHCVSQNPTATVWTDIMETCIQDCNLTDVPVPPMFFEIKRAVEKAEIANQFTAGGRQ